MDRTAGRGVRPGEDPGPVAESRLEAKPGRNLRGPRIAHLGVGPVQVHVQGSGHGPQEIPVALGHEEIVAVQQIEDIDGQVEGLAPAKAERLREAEVEVLIASLPVGVVSMPPTNCRSFPKSPSKFRSWLARWL